MKEWQEGVAARRALSQWHESWGRVGSTWGEIYGLGWLETVVVLAILVSVVVVLYALPGLLLYVGLHY